jgi:hypothetical protein
MRNFRLFTGMILFFLAFMPLGNLSAQTCPTGLVSYWKMDELSGLTLTDFAGSHNATCNVELAEDENGKIGVAQYFDYTKRASVSNSPDYAFTNTSSFTIVYWMKFTEVEYGGQDHVIISKGDYGGGAPQEAFISTGVNGSGKVNFLLGDSNRDFQQLESSSGYNDGNWHQVVCVRDYAAHMVSLYVDGIVVDSKDHAYTGNFINSASFAFCYLMSSNIMGYYYKGALDEVAVFNKALTPADISNYISRANIGVGFCDGLNPNISSVPNTVASVGAQYNYTVRAGGAQANMTYSLITNPAGMTINSGSGLISWTPASISDDGLVKVRAANNIAPADTQTFRIYISEVTVCPSNLLVLLKLDESNGPLYTDYYAAHNATASIAPSATPGKIHGAQAFNATTKLNIPDNGEEFEWIGNSSFSVEFWLKTVTNAAMVCVGRNRTDYNETASQWFVSTNASGKSVFEMRDNNGTVSTITGSKTVSDGQWHHIVAVRNGASAVNQLYVDGTLDASQSLYTEYTFKADDPTDINVGWFHRKNAGDPEYHFIGSLDEIAIYNRAVTASEASSYYNNGAPVGHCALGNFAPAATSTPVTNAIEGALYSYTYTADDPDVADVLVLSAVTKPSWCTFAWVPGQKTATLSGTPGTGAVGANNVTLRVSDGKLQKDQSFVITVVDVNNAPVVSSTHITSVNEDSPYSYTLTVTDADVNDNINMTVISKPSWLTFTHAANARTATLTGTPANSDIGSSSVDISITDGHATIHETYTLEVIAVNDAPVITAQSALTTNEDVAITLQKANFTITDEDNPLTDISLKVQAGTNYTYVGNTVTPAANFNGPLTVNLVASDPGKDSQPFQALVTVNPVNDAPVVSNPPDLNVQTGNLYAYIFSATDVDDVTLTKSVIQKPDWLAFSASTGVLTGTPKVADIGQALVILRVSDGKIDVDYDFVIVVDAASSLNDLESAGIKIYPVPAKEYLDIQFEKLSGTTSLEVINSNGSVVSKVMIPANSSDYRLFLNGIETGTYYLHIKNNTMNNIGRFVIVK